MNHATTATNLNSESAKSEVKIKIGWNGHVDQNQFDTCDGG
jgi:hypothetical protein